MADTEKRKIVRRSAEERVAEIDAKIATCKATIAKSRKKRLPLSKLKASYFKSCSSWFQSWSIERTA